MGGIQLPILCSWGCPRATHLACVCPEGHVISWRSCLVCQPPGDIFTCPKATKMPPDAYVYTTESHPQWNAAVCAKRLREGFLLTFFWQKIGVLFIPLCDICLFRGQNSQWRLDGSARSAHAPCQRGKKHFLTSFIAASAYIGDSCELLTPVNYCRLGSLALQCYNVLFGASFPLFVNPNLGRKME